VPELPEVETVRQGLAKWVTGRRINAVEVRHPRAIRRHVPGDVHFAAILAGRTITDVARRGKYLWLPLDSGDAIIAHLGMSGQLLMQPTEAADELHLRVRITFADDGPELRFVDQRTFGGLSVSEDGAELPREIAHIARDPMDPLFDDEGFVAALRRKHTEIKRALLDQTLISGVGNIYADEALWRAKLHGSRATDALTKPAVRRLLAHVRDVLGEAIVAGGTSFDALYASTRST
jgi:formamidopyrimidine-DNA glycosylase